MSEMSSQSQLPTQSSRTATGPAGQATIPRSANADRTRRTTPEGSDETIGSRSSNASRMPDAHSASEESTVRWEESEFAAPNEGIDLYEYITAH